MEQEYFDDGSDVGKSDFSMFKEDGEVYFEDMENEWMKPLIFEGMEDMFLTPKKSKKINKKFENFSEEKNLEFDEMYDVDDESTLKEIFIPHDTPLSNIENGFDELEESVKEENQTKGILKEKIENLKQKIPKTKPNLSMAVLKMIYLFFDQEYILEVLQTVSQKFKKASENCKIWKKYPPLISQIRSRAFKLERSLSSRISKGECFVITHKYFQKTYLFRKIDLKISNGKYFDGLTTPIMRQLTQLCSKNIQK